MRFLLAAGNLKSAERIGSNRQGERKQIARGSPWADIIRLDCRE
jgi:hypothetical protein